MYYTQDLYSKNANGKVIVWSARVTDEAETIIKTGILNGKIREIRHFTESGKNIGKSNYTNPYTQAVKELKAKTKLKIKNGYKSLEDLGNDIATLDLYGNRLYEVLDTRLAINKTDANNVLKPMKAVQFKKVKKFHFPYIVQPKINGFRSTFLMIKGIEDDMFSNTSAKLLSKEGHEYILEHITFNEDSLFQDNVVFDGELYVHNEILSNIKRRIPIINSIGTKSRNSLPSRPVKFYCFDLSITDINQQERIQIKNELLKGYDVLYYSPNSNRFVLTGSTTNIVNVSHVIANNLDDLYKYLDAALKSGFEGIVAREFDAEYMFGGRRTNMIKMKKLISGEFKILDIIKKNEDNVRTYIAFKLQNDINDKTFECTPEGDEDIRIELLNNKDKYIGKLVTATYYERTVNGLPFHAVGRIRDSFDMDVNDLQIEL